MSSLELFGIDSDSIQTLNELDFSTHIVFHIWEEPAKIDFLTRIGGVEFQEAFQQRLIASVEGVHIPFLHLHHLILTKMNSGRLKDLADVEELQKLKR